jgi:hypothetical protein
MHSGRNGRSWPHVAHQYRIDLRAVVDPAVEADLVDLVV